MKNEPGSVRLFVALVLPDALKTELARLQRELRDMLPAAQVSWTKPDNLHLTLRFLGDVDAARVTELEQALAAAVADFDALDLLCEGLGGFPDLRFPRVIWAGVRDAEARLGSLVQRVNDAVSSIATKPAEERFSGHITLIRPRRLRRHEAETVAGFVSNSARRCFGRWRAKEMHLIRSELLPAGSRYTTLACAHLAP